MSNIPADLSRSELRKILRHMFAWDCKREGIVCTLATLVSSNGIIENQHTTEHTNCDPHSNMPIFPTDLL
uniref:Uncharacterized protein n=1 Tax=Parascaris univalens TaxID=6257 RepID=A0A915C641_PARUN